MRKLRVSALTAALAATPFVAAPAQATCYAYLQDRCDGRNLPTVPTSPTGNR
jgi:hypothetical protein